MPQKKSAKKRNSNSPKPKNADPVLIWTVELETLLFEALEVRIALPHMLVILLFHIYVFRFFFDNRQPRYFML